MKHLKGLQKTLMASAVAVLAFGAAPALAVTSNDSFGSCIGTDTSAGGGAGNDCVTATGHISASVVGTLSINEMRAVSFGNFAVNCAAAVCDGGATLYLDPIGVRTAGGSGDAIILLNGGGSGANIGQNPGDPGSQSPGHYTVSGGAEATTSQVYISFADNAGNIIDACSPNGSPGGNYANGGHAGTIPDPYAPYGNYSGIHGTCDNYHPGAAVALNGPGGNTFNVDSFTFNESGSDVYGHYIDNQPPDTAGPVHHGVGPGSPFPFLPGVGAAHGATSAGGIPGEIDVVVGATLHTVAGVTYPAGKYSNTYEVMVSY